MNKEPQDTEMSVIQVVFNEQVTTYPRFSWRRSISAFLDGVWSQLNLGAEGFILFAPEKIILSLRNGEYRVPNRSSTLGIPRPDFNRDQIHTVSSKRDDIELGLAKFVRNNLIRQLVIEFACMRLMLWKGDRRTDLHICLIDRTF